MTRDKKIIFDMDGTLYPYRLSAETGLPKLHSDLNQRVLEFFRNEFAVDDETAKLMYEEINEQYDGSLSIGLERLYGVDRYRFFADTWVADPQDYMKIDLVLAKKLMSMRGDVLLLTAAPRVWATRVLDYLGLSGVFEEKVITGEPDLRKPNPEVFQQAARILESEPSSIISVGDQNHSDILPAKSLGMVTIIVGTKQYDADYHADDIHSALELIEEELL